MRTQDLAQIVSAMHGLMPEPNRFLLAAWCESAILRNAPADFKANWDRGAYYGACGINQEYEGQADLESLIRRWDGINKWRDDETGEWTDLSKPMMGLINTLTLELHQFWTGQGVVPLTELNEGTPNELHDIDGSGRQAS